jgi:hypothetical protein
MPRDLDFKREKRVRSRVHSFDMVRSQLPGLAAQVARGQVKNVVILDGANDFLLPLKAVEAGTLEPAAFSLGVRLCFWFFIPVEEPSREGAPGELKRASGFPFPL